MKVNVDVGYQVLVMILVLMLVRRRMKDGDLEAGERLRNLDPFISRSHLFYPEANKPTDVSPGPLSSSAE